MSKPDEITLWTAVDLGAERWIYSLEPRWDEERQYYVPDVADADYREIIQSDDLYAAFFNDLTPCYKRPVTLTVKLGKAVKG